MQCHPTGLDSVSDIRKVSKSLRKTRFRVYPQLVGRDADACYITLKATEMLVIPETGTDVAVSLGYRSPRAEIWEVFKGVANRTGFSGPSDKLTIQATGVALSDDKRMQGSHERSWNEATLGEIVTDIIQGAGFRARVHSDLKNVELKRAIQSIESDIELLSRLVEAYGGILKSDGETVAVVPRDSLESASGAQLPTVTLDKSVCPQYSWANGSEAFSSLLWRFTRTKRRARH